MDGYRADGYYYDWLERQWVLPVPRKLTLRQKRVRDRLSYCCAIWWWRSRMAHWSWGPVLIQLYATLTAKALLQSNPELMNQAGA